MRTIHHQAVADGGGLAVVAGDASGLVEVVTEQPLFEYPIAEASACAARRHPGV